MQVFVYRSVRKQGAYLYVPRRDAFDAVPPPILQSLGRLDFALEFELTPDRKLAREDAATVLQHLKERGFHLQLPPNISIDPMTDDWGTDA